MSPSKIELCRVSEARAVEIILISCSRVVLPSNSFNARDKNKSSVLIVVAVGLRVT